MKYAILLSTVFLVPHFDADAQHIFNVRNTLHSITTQTQSVIPLNGKYYCFSCVLDSDNYVGAGEWTSFFGINFSVFDSTGNLIKDTIFEYRPSSISLWYRTVQMSSAGIFYVGAWMDNGDETSDILQFDTLDNCLAVKRFDQPFCTNDHWYRLLDLKPTGTGEWLMLCQSACYDRNILVVTKVDASLNVEWQKQYGSSIYNNIASKIMIDSQGYVIAGFVSNNNLSTLSVFYRAQLIRTDTAGTEQWTWLSDSSRQTELSDIIRTKDGGYVYGGRGNGVESIIGGVPQVTFGGWIEKLDSNRKVLWNRSYPRGPIPTTTFINVIREDSITGHILLFGAKTAEDTVHNIYHGRGWFGILSDNGDSLSEHTYYYVNDCSDDNEIVDARATQDRGFILCGQAIDQCPTRDTTIPSQQNWLLKIDSNGNTTLSTDTTVVALRRITMKEINVYPNPAHYSINVVNAATMSVGIYNIVGQQVFSTYIASDDQHIEITFLPVGIYIMQFVDRIGMRRTVQLVKE